MEISQVLDLSAIEAAGSYSTGRRVKRCPDLTKNFSSCNFTDKGDEVKDNIYSRNNQEYPDQAWKF